MSKQEFEQIYKYYYKEMYKFIFTIARRNKFFADDIFQNTMESAYKGYSKLEHTDNIKAWLYKIARTESSRYFYRQKNNLYPNTELLNSENYDDYEKLIEPDFSIESIESQLLLDTINQLNDTEQSVMILHYYYDLKLKDISEITGINESTVKSLHIRTLKKMKQMLDGRI